MSDYQPSAYPPPAGPNYYGQPGSPYNGYYQVPPEPKYNVLSIVSLVSAFFVSLAAVICGHIALSQIKRTGEKGRGMALAGVILGYLGMVGGIVFGIIIFLAALASVPTSELEENRNIGASQMVVAQSEIPSEAALPFSGASIAV